MRCELLFSGPVVPIWWVTECESRRQLGDALNDALYPGWSIGSESWPTFRGVSLGRLPVVLRTGVDVQPSDARIYCSDFDKAWEYGGTSVGVGPRMIFALNQYTLKSTYTYLDLDATPAEIAEVQATYPHQHREHHGSLRFSRLDSYSPGYEDPYAFWIPGDTKEALMAVFILGLERDEAMAHVLAALAWPNGDESNA